MSKSYYYRNSKQKQKKRVTTKAPDGPRLLSEEIRSTYFLLLATITCMLVASVLGYLYISSQKAAKGYLLKQLQIEYEDLTVESKTLDSELLEVMSITNLSKEEPVTDMEKPGSEEFSFVDNDTAVAQKSE